MARGWITGLAADAILTTNGQAELDVFSPAPQGGAA
jgi:hypothetical protein